MAEAKAPAVKVTPEEDFDTAFDQAVVEGEKAIAASSDEPVKEPAKDEPKKVETPKASEPVKDPVKEPVTPPVEKTPVEIATEVATAAIAKAQEAAETRAAAKATKDAEDAAAAKATKDAEDAAVARDAPYEPSEEEKKAMAVFQKEFPNEYVAMESRMKAQQKAFDGQVYKAVKEMNEKLAKLEQGIAPLKQTVATTQQDAHFATIKAAHADYDAIVKALPAWIETLPAHKRIGAQAVFEGGNAAAVIALFEDYKKENNIAAPLENTDTPKPAAKDTPKPVAKPTADEIASGTPVGSRRAAPSVKGAPDKEDYDGAWAEATKDD